MRSSLANYHASRGSRAKEYRSAVAVAIAFAVATVAIAGGALQRDEHHRQLGC